MRHEVHLLRRGLVATVPFVLLLLLAAGTLRGRQAAASVAVGAGVILVNQLLSVASTAWARVFGPAAAATAYAGWVVRMGGVLAALSLATSLAWVDRPALAVSFCATLAVLLGAECVAYARKSYVPAWRMAR